MCSFTAGLSMTNETPNEQKIASEVANLWSIYNELRTAGKDAAHERKVLHLSLGGRLDDIKRSLARRGRGGRWSKFLLSCGIDRSSADRAVRAYQRTLCVGANTNSENPVTATNAEPLRQPVPSAMASKDVVGEAVSAPLRPEVR